MQSTSSRVPTPRVKRQRSYLGRLTVGFIILVIGVLAALDVADVTRPELKHYVGAAVLVIGVGLIIGAFIGRSRWLIGLGVLLLPLLLISAVVPASVFGEYGERVYRPTSAADVLADYELGGGELTFDLRDLTLERDIETSIELGAGESTILVPDDLNVVINGEVGFGEVDIDRLHVITVEAFRNDGSFVIDGDLLDGDIDVDNVGPFMLVDSSGDTILDYDGASGFIRVVDVDGEEVVVLFSDGFGYLDPIEFESTFIGDDIVIEEPPILIGGHDHAIHDSGGVGLSRTHSNIVDDGAPTLTINVDVGFGSLQIRQDA